MFDSETVREKLRELTNVAQSYDVVMTRDEIQVMEREFKQFARVLGDAIKKETND